MSIAWLYLLLNTIAWAAPTYYAGAYPADHWALQYPSLTDEHVIGIVRWDGLEFGVRMHPNDRRGYRGLVVLIDRDMKSTINRPYAARERRGLHHALALVSEAYERLGLISQVLVLGNNAHVFDPSNCEILLGTAHEPNILHGHVIGRGNPRFAYAGGVTLGGPAPGEVFGVRDRSAPWAAGEVAGVASALREALVAARADARDI